MKQRYLRALVKIRRIRKHWGIPHSFTVDLDAIPHWVWLTFIAAILRFVNLGQESLWYDESFTVWLAKLDLPHMWQAIQGDVHPPLWYLVEWVNTRTFGTSPFALRLPDALLGIACVLMVWRLGELIGFDRPTRFVAGWLVAVVPAFVYYSQDARMYPLLCFFVLWATINTLKKKWGYVAAACTGALYTQNLAVFYVAVLALYIVVTEGGLRCFTKKSGRMLVLSGVAYAPWLPSMIHQATAIKQSFWVPPLTWQSALFPTVYMTIGWRIPDGLQAHFYAVAFGLSIVGIIVSRHWLLTRNGVLISLVVLGVPALMAIVSITWRSIYLARALLPSTMMLMLFWAYALCNMSIENKRIARWITVPTLIVALMFHYFPAIGGRSDIQQFLSPILTGIQPGDTVYYTALDSLIQSNYYMNGNSYYVTPEVGDLNQSLSDATKAAMSIKSLPFDQLKVHGFNRVWLIVTQNPLTSQTELDEIAHIKATYQYQTIKTDGNDYANQSILLVTL